MVLRSHAFLLHHCAVFQGLLSLGKLKTNIHSGAPANDFQIVNTLGFNETITYLIQAPPYIFAYAVTLLVSWSSGRMLEHCWHICGAMFAALVGTVIMISTLNVAARYFSLFLLCTGPFIALNVSHLHSTHDFRMLIFLVFHHQ